MSSPDPVLASLGLEPSTSAELMTGFDATVWRVESGGRTFALRWLRADAPMEREVAALRLAAERGLPVPELLAVGRHDGRDAVVTSWCPGRTIGDLLSSGGSSEALGRLFGRTQADLHRPGPDGSVLCHLDFQPFNVIVEHDVVTGIVDWANARPGDPREDLAQTRVVLALAPALLPGAADQVAVFTAAWQHGYRERRRMPRDRELAPFLAAAAKRQLRSWEPRAGTVPQSVLDRAWELAETAW